MLYDYQCDSCGHIQEELHSATELNTFKFVCKQCGFENGHRLISAPRVISMGSIDSSMFLGGNLTKMDTLNGKPKRKKRVYNQ